MVKTFQVGDFVKLKSGGPLMTVRVIEPDRITCTNTWFGDVKQRVTFDAKLIEKYDIIMEDSFFEGLCLPR